MTELMLVIASVACPVSAWMASTRRAMSSVARAVSCASSLTSLATTAKPLPASPARAASMVALSASRLVCSAIEAITFSTLPISVEEPPSLVTVALAARAVSTAEAATCAACWALTAISWTDALISSAPLAVLCTCEVTWVAATAEPWARSGTCAAELEPDGDLRQSGRGGGQGPDAVVDVGDRRAHAAGGLVQRAGHVAHLVARTELEPGREVLAP